MWLIKSIIGNLITQIIISIMSGGVSIFLIIDDNVLRTTPNFLWYSILVILSVYWLVLLYRRRKRNIESNRSQITFLKSEPVYGWYVWGEYVYEGLVWNVKTPKESLFGMMSERVVTIYDSPIESIELDSDPLCVKCKTELVVKESVLKFNTYKCENCKKSIRKLKDKFDVKDSALRVLKGIVKRREIKVDEE